MRKICFQWTATTKSVLKQFQNSFLQKKREKLLKVFEKQERIFEECSRKVRTKVIQIAGLQWETDFCRLVVKWAAKKKKLLWMVCLLCNSYYTRFIRCISYSRSYYARSFGRLTHVKADQECRSGIASVVIRFEISIKIRMKNCIALSLSKQKASWKEASEASGAILRWQVRLKLCMPRTMNN